MRTALTIAGSDSSGGAGIQADIKTMTANGVFAMSAITALTAQNTTGVAGIMEVSPEFLKQQIAVYNADVLLCCGCAKDTNLILDFVRSQYLTDLQVVPSTGEWIYYSPSTGKWVINSYHPSARIGYEENYEGMMHAFRLALATQTKDSDQKGCIGGMTTETK